jgi:hypothetical protein
VVSRNVLTSCVSTTVIFAPETFFPRKYPLDSRWLMGDSFNLEGETGTGLIGNKQPHKIYDAAEDNECAHSEDNPSKEPGTIFYSSINETPNIFRRYGW